MEWQDEGIVLATRPHGETGLILSLLTSGQGRHSGLVRGGYGLRLSGLLQLGNTVQAHWRARQAERLGYFTCESLCSRAAFLLGTPDRLAALVSAVTLCEIALPERQPCPEIFADLTLLLDTLLLASPSDSGSKPNRNNHRDSDQAPAFARFYVHWECRLLTRLGFGLDFSCCAATGIPRGPDSDLIYVSPRTGRSVSRKAGEELAHKLLPLPAFLLNPDTDVSSSILMPDILRGLRLTGYFLGRCILADRSGGSGAVFLPAARLRFIQCMTARY